jgi:hypothetical protein
MHHTDLYRTLRDRGQSRDEALAELRRAGASPMFCIRAIHEAEGTGIVESKRLFTESPSWADVVQATNASFIEELEAEDLQ